jgi:hypothetical protein
MSLEQYEAPRKGRTCKVCLLPPAILEEMTAGYKRGTRWTAMIRWLEGDHNMTDVAAASISMHFARGHHNGNP